MFLGARKKSNLLFFLVFFSRFASHPMLQLNLLSDFKKKKTIKKGPLTKLHQLPA